MDECVHQLLVGMVSDYEAVEHFPFRRRLQNVFDFVLINEYSVLELGTVADVNQVLKCFLRVLTEQLMPQSNPNIVSDTVVIYSFQFNFPRHTFLSGSEYLFHSGFLQFARGLRLVSFKQSSQILDSVSR